MIQMGMVTLTGKKLAHNKLICVESSFSIFFLFSHDLLAVCRELSLEDSLEELMQQLGADSQGRISYEQFLNRRLALRPEIDALKGTTKDNISENSQGM